MVTTNVCAQCSQRSVKTLVCTCGLKPTRGVQVMAGALPLWSGPLFCGLCPSSPTSKGKRAKTVDTRTTVSARAAVLFVVMFRPWALPAATGNDFGDALRRDAWDGTASDTSTWNNLCYEDPSNRLLTGNKEFKASRQGRWRPPGATQRCSLFSTKTRTRLCGGVVQASHCFARPVRNDSMLRLANPRTGNN